jgi:hypothetical protein
MNRLRIVNSPTKLTDLRLDDLDYDNSDSWLQRARRLQVRRWRQLSSQLKSNSFSKKMHRGGKAS